MHHVITLLGASSSSSAFAKAQNWLTEHSINILNTHHIVENIAYDIMLEAKPRPALMQQFYQLAHEEWQIDTICQPAETRRKKLLIADMDATMVEEETLDVIADILGFGEKVTNITQAAMRGELNFKSALIERVKLLHGAPVSVLEEAWSRTKISPGAKALVQGMKQADAHSILVSGGFTFFTEKVADTLGFDAHIGNELEIIDGALTGQVLGDILDKNAKQAILQATCQQHGITPQDALAIGDGANDIPMLTAAGLGVAYRGKPLVKEACETQLNIAELDSLLHVQGLG